MWDVYNRERRYQPVGVVSRLPTARKGFQRRLPTPRWGIGKTERGDDKEGCHLVTAADSGRQLLQGEEGGFRLWRLQA